MSLRDKVKVPNADRAVVDIRKLMDYCLSHEHPRGKHKARVFLSALGVTTAHAGEFRDALLQKVRSEDCVPSPQSMSTVLVTL